MGAPHGPHHSLALCLCLLLPLPASHGLSAEQPAPQHGNGASRQGVHTDTLGARL